MNTIVKQNILLAVCGGIAAYKSAELVRLLRKQGAEVRVAMTTSAKAFVTPLTFQALSGNPVNSELLDVTEENAMGHINLARWADSLIIAPATANMIAQCAHGLADDLVSTLVLAATCPIFMAPAMNQAMWSKPVTQANIHTLKRNGIRFIGPDSGDQACGETGLGRMSEPAEICRQLFENLEALENSILKGTRVLISAGPTREAIDPVRYLTNRSSGKMGYALAAAAQNAGAEVCLVSGPVHLSSPAGVDFVPVESAEQMYDAVISRAENYDIYIGAAAVADYSPHAKAEEKIKKEAKEIALALVKTKDILSAVAQLERRPFVVGFAAETDNLEQYALDKLQAKNLDLIAANWVGRPQGGFEHEDNALELFWKNGRTSLPMMAKHQLANELINIIAKKFNEKNRI